MQSNHRTVRSDQKSILQSNHRDAKNYTNYFDQNNSLTVMLKLHHFNANQHAVRQY